MSNFKFVIASFWNKAKNIVTNRKTILIVWILFAVITAVKQYQIGRYNNYLIFKYTFWHAINQLNLYIPYPEYFDVNHYGPFFSLFFAPFAVLPDIVGMLFWQLCNTLFLFFAISKLPLSETKKVAILWICAHELLTSLFSYQINPSITAIIILAYVLIDSKKDFGAAFFIMLGTFVKLYGIVGLAFFFFSKQKGKLILSLLFWAVTFFVLPMFIFGPAYILKSYNQWYLVLTEKNLENVALTSFQDISLMGMFRRISGNPELSNLPFIIGGLLLFGAPYLRIKQYAFEGFRLMILASVLLFVVLFSTGSESPTYIIAFVGVALWFIIHQEPYTKMDILLLVFALFLTSFSPSDLFPKYIRVHYVIPYALKALPCAIIWIKLSIELCAVDFSSYITTSSSKQHE
jgi:hypothetical protein